MDVVEKVRKTFLVACCTNRRMKRARVTPCVTLIGQVSVTDDSSWSGKSGID